MVSRVPCANRQVLRLQRTDYAIAGIIG